jgi:hypothetical protein
VLLFRGAEGLGTLCLEGISVKWLAYLRYHTTPADSVIAEYWQ